MKMEKDRLMARVENLDQNYSQIKENVDRNDKNDPS